jgi:drug/metabolite transporter superfamily protein YnfA
MTCAKQGYGSGLFKGRRLSVFVFINLFINRRRKLRLLKTGMKKALGILFAALLVLTTFAGTDMAQARNGRTGAFVGGALLGTLAGAAIVDANRHDRYDCRAYGDCYGPRYRAEPRGGLVYNDDRDCWVSRRDYWGPCRAY